MWKQQTGLMPPMWMRIFNASCFIRNAKVRYERGQLLELDHFVSV